MKHIFWRRSALRLLALLLCVCWLPAPGLAEEPAADTPAADAPAADTPAQEDAVQGDTLQEDVQEEADPFTDGVDMIQCVLSTFGGRRLQLEFHPPEASEPYRGSVRVWTSDNGVEMVELASNKMNLQLCKTGDAAARSALAGYVLSECMAVNDDELRVLVGDWQGDKISELEELNLSNPILDTESARAWDTLREATREERLGWYAAYFQPAGRILVRSQYFSMPYAQEDPYQDMLNYVMAEYTALGAFSEFAVMEPHPTLPAALAVQPEEETLFLFTHGGPDMVIALEGSDTLHQRHTAGWVKLTMITMGMDPDALPICEMVEAEDGRLNLYQNGVDGEWLDEDHTLMEFLSMDFNPDNYHMDFDLE